MMSFVATAIWGFYHFSVGCHHVRVISVSVAFNGWLLFMFISFFGNTYKKTKGN